MTAATINGVPTVQRVLDGYIVIIGAQRCGSTMLHRLLDAHHEISMVKPARPEPKVFLHPGLDHGGLRTWLEERRTGLDPEARLFGEKSTSYIESPVAAGNIDRLVPGARLVAIVRNPIDRAVSNYRFSVANGLETDPIDVALSRELSGGQPHRVPGVSVSPFAYLERGRYIDHLDHYQRQSSADRLDVVVLEGLIEQPDSIGDLYRRLGVDDSFRPGSGVRSNAAEGDPPAVSRALRTQLREYFDSANGELAERFALDISPWT